MIHLTFRAKIQIMKWLNDNNFAQNIKITKKLKNNNFHAKKKCLDFQILDFQTLLKFCKTLS